MQDISREMLEFKEAIRHIWNTSFVTSESPMSPVVQAAYNDIESALFRTLVLDLVGIQDERIRYRKSPVSFVRVVSHSQELPMQFGLKGANGGIAWTALHRIIVPADMHLSFDSFFNWGWDSYIDLPYVKVFVEKLAGYSQYEGLSAIIEQQYCSFMFLD